MKKHKNENGYEQLKVVILGNRRANNKHFFSIDILYLDIKIDKSKKFIGNDIKTMLN